MVVLVVVDVGGHAVDEAAEAFVPQICLGEVEGAEVERPVAAGVVGCRWGGGEAGGQRWVRAGVETA